MFNILHTFHPQPILVQIGPFAIHWYGLIMALAAGAGLWLVLRLRKSIGLSEDSLYNLALWTVIGGLIGARLYYIFYNFTYYRGHLGEIFSIWNGGLAIYGAMIGGSLAIYLFSKKYRLDFMQLADLLVPSLLLGQVIGRFGNYFNQELFGTPTTLLWGIPIDPANRPAQYPNAEYFHPTFLYESGLNVLFLIFILRAYKKPWAERGMILGIYLIGYGIIRILMETMRTDFTPFLFGIRWQTLASVAALLTGIAIVATQYYRGSSRTE